MRIARSIITCCLLVLVAAGCGSDGNGSEKAGAERDAGRMEKGGDGEVVEADLKVRIEHVGDKSSGAGIAIPTDIACTKSIPATCRADYVCPASRDTDQGICDWLATDAARDVLLKEPAKDMMCTQQYGGPEVATVTGTLDGKDVDATFTRTDGCAIGRFDAAAPLWTRELPTPSNGATDPSGTTSAPMCVAEDPDKPVSSDNPPVPCEELVVEPEVITDPEEAFER